MLLRETNGVTAVGSGGVVAFYGLVALVGSTQAGRLTTTYDSFFVLVAGFVVGGVGLGLLGLGLPLPVIMVGVLLFGVGYGVAGPVQKSLVTQFSPPSVRAGAVSSAVVIQSIGQTAGPLVMGISLQAVPITTAFLVPGVMGSILSALLITIASWMRDDAQRPNVTPGD